MQQDIKQDFIDHLLSQALGLSNSEAEEMLEWMEENNWRNYDGIDRWINTKNRKVVETTQLIEIYGINKI